jgi:hypothetical protein
VWRRLRSKTVAPRRPALFPEQWPLAVFTAVLLVGSIAVVVYAVTR